MKLTTWNRGSGHVAVVLFENKRSAAVFTGKVMKTKVGAQNYCKRIEELCGENYELRNLRDLQFTTDPETGKKTRNFEYENLSSV